MNIQNTLESLLRIFIGAFEEFPALVMINQGLIILKANGLECLSASANKRKLR